MTFNEANGPPLNRGNLMAMLRMVVIPPFEVVRFEV